MRDTVMLIMSVMLFTGWCKAQQSCPPGEFQCNTKGALECIDQHLKCNGLPECSDNSDEEGCDVSSFDNCCGITDGCQATGAPNFYRYIEPSDSNPNIIYVGAMNFMFALDTSQPQLTCNNVKYLPQDEVTRGRCTRQGKADIPDCQNHIREILEIDGLLEVCGTGAYAPKMYYLNVDDMMVNRTGYSTKLPTCPYDPLDNNTLLYSKYGNPGNSSAMYFGFYMDFIKNFPVFLRPRYDHEGTIYVEKMTDTEDSSWLDSPQFVGSFDMSNSVLMFFREKAVEFQEAGDQIYSRVGKVCKNDLGGGSVDIARKKWLSFQKARLICSLPGTQPYYFNDIYDVAYDGNKYFYALFYKHGAHLNASAICVYDIDDITAAFEGHFMFKNGSMVKPSPDPRLDDCRLHDESPSIFNGMSSHYQLMYTRVEPVSGEPIFYRHGNQLLRLALGPLKQNKFRNIYVGTSKGEIWDIFVKEEPGNWDTYLNAKLLPFANTPQPTQAIWKIMMKDNYLLTGTDYQVTKIPLDFCDQIQEANSTAERNLDECLYNTRCKLAQCGGAWKCKQADDDSCDNAITLSDVQPDRTIREHILRAVKPDDDVVSPYLVFTTENYGTNNGTLQRLELASKVTTTLRTGMVHSPALDFIWQPDGTYLFWNIDDSEGSICKGKVTGNTLTDSEIIISGVDWVRGAVDWISRRLYWTDYFNDRIEVANLDGTNRTTIIHYNMDTPTGIVVDPIEGWLFWTDADRDNPRIERCSLSGEHHSIIHNIAAGGRPWALTVDYEDKKIYWIDTRAHTISTMKYDGTSYRVLLQNQTYLSGSYGMSVYGDSLFWTDSGTRSILRANKFDASHMTVITKLKDPPLGIQVVHPSRQPRHRCDIKNGGCSDICIPIDDRTVSCRCSVASYLGTDRNTCLTPCPARSLYDEKLDTTATFSAAKVGEKTYSWERCYHGSGALASAVCEIGYDNRTSWSPVVFNAGCQPFPELENSSSTNNLRNLSETNMTNQNVNEILKDTVNLTIPDLNLTEADIIYTADILYNYRKFASPALLDSTLDDVYDIFNNAIQSSPDVISKTQHLNNAANRLIRTVDDLTNDLTSSGNKTIVCSFVATTTSLQTGHDDLVIGLELENSTNLEITKDILLSIKYVADVTDDKTDTAIYLSRNIVEGTETRLTFRIFSKTELFASPNGSFVVNSKVAAARLVRNNQSVTDLGEDRVTVIFKMIKDSKNVVCGWWDYNANEDTGGWKTEGCLLFRNGSKVTCECDHLTNFAVLIDLQADQILATHKFILALVTKIGLSISIIACGFNVLTFFIFTHLRNGRGQQVLINLSVAMICSGVIFLVGMDRTETRNGCMLVAGLLHYFLLASFAWMLVEGLLQYLRFVKVLGTYIPNFMCKTMITAWAVPVIPVIIVLGVNPDLYYGGKGYCWMNNSAMLYAFIIPVATIIFVNIVVFVLVMCNISCRRKKGMRTNQSERKMALLHLKTAVSVFVILGLTWVFGFLAIEGAQLVFHYIFAILNAFQGLFICLLFTAREEKIRKAWKKMCCKNSQYNVTGSSGTEMQNLQTAPLDTPVQT